jgi:uncharacterized membrane protein
MRFSRTMYGMILLGAAAWCGGIVAAPLLTGATEWHESGSWLYCVYAPICHQMPERSLTCAGAPLAVCARCTAIYGAFLLGTILYPLSRPLRRPAYPDRWLLAAALLPLCADVLLAAAGLWESTVAARIITGTLCGFVLPWFILPAAIEAIDDLTQEPLVQRTNDAQATE